MEHQFYLTQSSQRLTNAHFHPRNDTAHHRANSVALTSFAAQLAIRSPEIHTNVNKRFGLRLRALRTERRMTQVHMAVTFGIDRSFISDVERGKKSISLPLLEVISLGFKISLPDLLRDV